MSLNSIEHEWQGYWSMIKPKDPSQIQIDETKQAFFAGAWTLFCALEEIGCPHISQEQGEAYLEARRAEILAFKKDLMLKYVTKN